MLQRPSVKRKDRFYPKLPAMGVCFCGNIHEILDTDQCCLHNLKRDRAEFPHFQNVLAMQHQEYKSPALIMLRLILHVNTAVLLPQALKNREARFYWRWLVLSNI